MRSTFYCHTELGEPWSLEFPSIEDSVAFHVVTAGACWVRLPDQTAIELREGDLALVPHGLGHDLVSAPDASHGPRVDLLPQQYLSPQYSRLEYGGPGRTAQLICGIVSFDDAAARELMRALPRLIHVGRESAPAPAIRDTLRLMAAELSYLQPGGEAVATRLADILVVQAIREWLSTESDTGMAGWLRALQDDRIGKVVEAIHGDPGYEWSLESLARVAAMSRSAFSSRFTKLVGETPAAYLTRWRMNIAHTRLLEEDLTAGRLATDLGYRSEAAFNRAFTRVIGRTPGAIRRARQAT